MAIMSCPECGRSISDKAQACPNCGYPLQSLQPSGPGWPAYRYFGYEYKSRRMVFGLPLIHIVSGFPDGRMKVAKGFIAIGNIAVGVFALGGIAAGMIALGGVGLGLVVLGGVALGLGLGLGGVATGYLAIGGVAIGVYAIGGLSIGVHTVFNDYHFRRAIESLFRRFT